MFGFLRLLLLVALAPSVAQARQDVPAGRLERLARGVNLSHWLWLSAPRAGPERLAFIPDSDLKALAAAGCTHVRLPFEPGAVWDSAKHHLRQQGLEELTTAVARCLDAGLAVVVDAHPNESPWVTADDHFDEFIAFWTALAPALSKTDAERVFLEILNEPHNSAQDWPGALPRLVAAVRAGAPSHTIIATGEDWSNIPGLLALKPLADRNVVYTFHYYEPHTFTHQGATWGWPPWKSIKGLPYPATPESVGPIASEIKEPQARDAVLGYGRERWNRDRIRAQIQRAAAWGRESHVPIYCGEFGAYAAFTPREARLNWLGDAAASLTEAKIGWCMWDYTGGFALAPGEPGKRTIDADLAKAIGLSPAASK